MEEKEIVEFIAKERKKKNLSIGKLAELSGVNKGTVSRIESGEILSARVGTINRILNTLGYKLKIESINYVMKLSEYLAQQRNSWILLKMKNTVLVLTVL